MSSGRLSHGFLLFAALVTAVVLISGVACGDDGETGEEPPTSTPGAGAGGDEDPPGTMVVVPPQRPPVAIPSDWLEARVERSVPFSFRYPSTWYSPVEATLFSWDVAANESPQFPPDGVKVEVGVGKLNDPGGTVYEPPPGASDTTLGGLAAREVVWEFPDDSGLGLSRRHLVAAERNGYRILVYGYFGAEAESETEFLQILNSFRFIDCATTQQPATASCIPSVSP